MQRHLLFGSSISPRHTGRRHRFPALLAAVILTLAGCGGGGGGGGGDTPAPAPNPPPQPPDNAPYGLTSAPPAAALNFPIDGSVTPGPITLQAVASGFSAPVFFTAIPNSGGRSVIVEQSGQVKVLTAAFAVEAVLLDLSSRVIFSGEQGLLGLAFDPGVAGNGYFYVNYVSGKTGGRCASVPDNACTRISRFRLNSNGAGGFLYTPVAAAGEELLLEVSQPYTNHKGGMLVFGPDNYLYIGLGDGGSGGDPQNRAQDRTTLLGKVLRIDPNGGTPYAVPSGNPFFGNSSGWRPEIWAFGLRNPWRFSFDRLTGKLWLADVGQNAWEEINIITPGGNYGWNLREGKHFYGGNTSAPADVIDPVWEYDHGQGDSVTGGYVYRGNNFPELRGQYIYGDFAAGTIWALNATTYTNQLLSYNTANIQLSSFGEDSAGELYVVDYTGRLLRLSAGGGAGGAVPTQLSATGLFSNLSSLQVVPGLIEYDVNTALWSDGAAKRRWLALPAGGKITFSAGEAWQLPVGSVVVKHFAMALDQTNPGALRNLETRVLVRESAGWAGYTYRWNTQQTNADLITAGASEILNLRDSSGIAFTRQYDYPSSAQCLSCHTSAAGALLGLRTRQMNRNFAYAQSGVTDNQLRSFNHVNLFSGDIGAHTQYGAAAALTDTSVSVSQRARDYLDANCAQCHRPGGPTGVNLDLRSSTANTALNALNIMATGGNFGLGNNARIIVPGTKELSVLWERMRRTDAVSGRMPPLASHAVDQAAVDAIGQWIDAL